MNWFDRLERRFRWLAIPNLPLILTVGQVGVFAMSLVQGEQWASNLLSLRPAQLRDGEVWRLFAFLFEPPTFSVIWFFFGIMAFFMMSDALERVWGSFRFNLYVLMGWLLNCAVAIVAMFFADREQEMSVLYLQTSIFLAFAWLFPDFEFSLYFVFPIRVKYLAYVTWTLLFFALAGALTFFRQGGWLTALTIVASVSNFLIFFAPDLIRAARAGHRRYAALGAEAAARRSVRHTCAACGANNLTHPDLEFRYCTQCVGTPGYCEHHIRNHEHKQVAGGQ